MKGKFQVLGAAGVMLALATSTVAADQQVVTGHVPAVTVGAQAVGSLDVSAQLDLAIGLPLRNRPALTNLLHNLYDPASPSYHQYLTPDQFTEQFGPSQEDYQAVIDFAKAHNLALRKTHANRTLLDVTGSVGDIQKAFHVQLHYYKHPTEARTYFAPDVEPSLDITNPVLAINGLNNYVVPQPGGHPGNGGAPATVGGGSAPDGSSYLGSDFRKAYAPGVTLNGAGQTVALLELEGYYTNDIAAYRTLAGIPNITMTNVLIDGATGIPSNNANEVGEVSLDIEMVLAMAPGISRLMVYEAPNSGGYWLDILSQMVTDNQARQISSSWLVGNNSNADQLYQQMAAQGQSFFQCSGDYGAFYQGVQQMADSEFFTTVGATTLTTGSGASYTSETAWSNYADDQGVQSTGGGISWNYTIPTWQQGLNMTNNQGSTAQRNVPDVAMVGDRVWVIWNNGSSNWWWGTSAAAPLWAGFAALVNQQAVTNGDAPIGFINPAVYAIGKSSNYTNCFHDIITGNNTNSVVTTNYYAVTGYDLCTGWGTPKGAPLISALAPNYSLRVTPWGGFTSGGGVGGPFSVTTETFVLSNALGATLNWTLSNSASWLSVSASSGTLANGHTANVTVSLNNNAASLGAGVYSATVWFTNLSGVALVAEARQFVLQVGQPLIQNGGFETGDYTGWNVSGQVYYNDIGTAARYVHSGNYGAKLGGYGTLSYLSQTLLTPPGYAYLLSCWFDNAQTGTPNEFSITWNGDTLFDGVNLGMTGWTNFQYLVTTPLSATPVQFGFRNDATYFGFDDVSVTPIPLPDFKSVTHSNTSVVLAWSTVSNFHYQVQYNTDLSTNWTNLGGRILANGSTLGTTDSAPGTRRFYRVVMTQ